MEDSKALNLIGFNSKQDLIDYGKLKGVDCDYNESVENIYNCVTGKTIKELEKFVETRNKVNTESFIKVEDKVVYIDLAHPDLNEIPDNDFFFVSKKGTSQVMGRLKNNVILFNIHIFLVEDELKLTKNVNWLEIKNNYFKVRKFSPEGKIYIYYKKITTKEIDTKPKRRRSLSREKTEQSLQRISGNLNKMVLQKKEDQFKQANSKSLIPRFVVSKDVAEKLSKK